MELGSIKLKSIVANRVFRLKKFGFFPNLNIEARGFFENEYFKKLYVLTQGWISLYREKSDAIKGIYITVFGNDISIINFLLWK